MRRGRPNMLPGIPVEDLLMYLAQCRARVGAELLDESFTHRTKGFERVRLSATTELGQHQLPGQAFVERMVGNHRGDLRQQLTVATDSQPGVVAVKGHCKSFGLQRGTDVVQPRRVERRERYTPPHRQRPPNRPSASPGSVAARARLVNWRKQMQIDRRRISCKHIAAGLSGDLHTIGRDYLPKPG